MLILYKLYQSAVFEYTTPAPHNITIEDLHPPVLTKPEEEYETAEIQEPEQPKCEGLQILQEPSSFKFEGLQILHESFHQISSIFV